MSPASIQVALVEFRNLQLVSLFLSAAIAQETDDTIRDAMNSLTEEQGAALIAACTQTSVGMTNLGAIIATLAKTE